MVMASSDVQEMAAAIKTAKAELRKTIGTSLKTLTQESIDKQSSIVYSNLVSLSEYHGSRSISVFLSMPAGEINTVPIVNHALGAGKSVYIPYLYKNAASNGPKSVMDMIELHSKEDFAQLKPDRWGIPSLQPEDVPERQRFPAENIGQPSLDLIVMPGVAFDKDLRRLGHGKGYYDFFLERYRKSATLENKSMPFLVGVALQEQVLTEGDDVPVDDSDWSLDALIVGDGSTLRPPISS